MTHLTDFYCKSNPHKLGQIPGNLSLTLNNPVIDVVYIIAVKINTIIININNVFVYIFEVTVKILKIWTPEKFAVIIIKFEQRGFTVESNASQRCKIELQTV